MCDAQEKTRRAVGNKATGRQLRLLLCIGADDFLFNARGKCRKSAEPLKPLKRQNLVRTSFHVCDFNVIKPKPDYQSCASEAAHSRHTSEFIANDPHAINKDFNEFITQHLNNAFIQ